MKTAIELDIFQEMKLEENTGEIVMRPMATMMDAPLDYCLLYTSPSPRDQA